MISLPLFLLAGLATYFFLRMDLRVPLLLAALVCGYALATSPLSGAIDGLGTGVGAAIESANSASE
ncbi:hypothetical protein [Streptomyces sp. 35G-GA-8]|uniref:hypothetical protein n=1 Tax=Streptomyces sp. 35G-GA-8 TaxID=2939434 RepID=UPI00201F909E|nr:hypothetical protein [Streptomyces sp. 35G-GA-8]MCL7382193.1 hypothetical protein [Streptomyces sp. 35G-GA-8]